MTATDLMCELTILMQFPLKRLFLVQTILALGLVAYLTSTTIGKTSAVVMFVAPFVVTALLALVGFAEKTSALLVASLSAFAFLAVCYCYYYYEIRVRLPREGGVSSDALADLFLSLPITLPLVMTLSVILASKATQSRKR